MEDFGNIKEKEFAQIESKCFFDKIKNDYFLQKVFGYLQEKKLLEITKYSNKIKRRLDITNDNYKKFCDIEIEIKPDNNGYGKFINIEKEKELYYHIYFNDNKEEIKRNYLKENDNATKLKIIIDYQIKSFAKLFYDCECIEYIYFKKFCRNNINNMGSMFRGCPSLKELNLSNFNTNNVIDLNNMFNLHPSNLKVKINESLNKRIINKNPKLIIV